MIRRAAALSFFAAAALTLLSACNTGSSCKGCADVDVRIPWGANDTHTYNLRIDGKDRGKTTLTVKEQGDQVLLTVHSADDSGNSDESTVTADKSSLKPISNTHAVIDSDQKRVANATYETGAEDCDSREVVKIEQLVYKPPDEATPDSTRSSPLCVPEHSYDNDESLFLWRAIPFEKGYNVSYHTVLSNRRDTQIVSLEVHDKVSKTPLGDGEAWEVRLTADQINQRAWFSTDPSHVMLAYQNDNYLFLLAE
jgi:hypothetical protein